MTTLNEESVCAAYKMIEDGDITGAKDTLREIYSYDFNNGELKFAIWCCSFWEQKLLPLVDLDVFEKAESIVFFWKEFCDDKIRFLEKYKNLFVTDGEFSEEKISSCLYSVKKGIFTMALKLYETLFDEKDNFQRGEIFRKAGLCYKKLGDYEKSLEFLDEANILCPGNSSIIAERGDCYALVGDERIARILLKEAFFIDASKIDVDFLDSELICTLVRKVSEMGYTGYALLEWIAVYGVLWGVFNIKRPLRSQEVGRLRQDIYSIENELKDPSNPSDILSPRLIKLYFWLIDYYVSVNDASGRINEVLLKIKLQDLNVYQQYVK